MKGKVTVFNDLLKYVSRKKFDEIVNKHNGDKWCKKFFCWDLFVMLLHGQFSGETSMRSVDLSNSCQKKRLAQIDAHPATRSTLSDACATRKPEIFMDIFAHLLSILKRSRKLNTVIQGFIHLIDATPIPLKGYGFEWAKNNYRTTGLKIHTTYDHALKTPVHFTISPPNVNDITEAKKISLKAKGTYIFDKGYYDYAWWNDIDKKGSRFVTRLKKDAPYKIIERKFAKSDCLHDWVIKLTSKAGQRFKGLLRHIRVKLTNNKTIVIVTNDLKSDATEISRLYKCRWEIELFFKCIKQNLKIKQFWGKNENAVKLQIITAMIAYVLLRIAQINNDTRLSIKQIRTIVRIKLHDYLSVYRVLKIPDRLGEQKIGGGIYA
jgi:hypothetical protein